MHPMIAERLDLWRLSNFNLERLPSAEDVYLFHAVARENPKDERLIAIAEVRDLTPARDSAGRTIGFPHLEGVLAQALADIRHALGRRPPKQRPLSNRVILYVRPTWDIASGNLARRGAPAGADGRGPGPGEGRGPDQDAGRGHRRDPGRGPGRREHRRPGGHCPGQAACRPADPAADRVPAEGAALGAPRCSLSLRADPDAHAAGRRAGRLPGRRVRRVRPRRRRRGTRAGRPALRSATPPGSWSE